MRKANVITALLLAGSLTVSVVPMHVMAQNASETQAAHSWTTEQAVTSSVREAWILGGRTEDGFFEIVKTLAALSAQKRNITPPEDKEAGAKAGEWIKKQAKKDPDQLLYVIVDEAVQRSAKAAK